MYDEILNIFTKRRSVRSFTDQPVEQEKIELLLKAAMAVPPLVILNHGKS